ncbi:MAG: hypothetical protein QXH27_01170 [Candidatus Micrarchaeia archaeon]
MAEEKTPEALEPRVDGFRFAAKRKKGVEEVTKALSPLSFLEVAPEGDVVALINVESRDISKNPYSFTLTYLKPESIELMYTIPPGTSPRKRRVDVFRFLLNLLTLLDECYEVDRKEFYQLIDAAFKGVGEYVSSSYDEIFAKYDACRSENEILRKRVESLQSTNDRLGKDNMELKEKNDALALRLRELESYSDDVLMLKIQEWLLEHKNEINIGEFSKVHKVREQRVEQVLNRMVTEGLLAVRE